MRYRTGDELVLKIEEDFGHTDKTYRAVKVQVIGFNLESGDYSPEILVYVPPYEHIKASWPMSDRHATWYHVDRKFVGSTVMFIEPLHPIYKHFPAPQGEKCCRCKEFFEGVTMVDGRYTCRACRINPYR